MPGHRRWRSRDPALAQRARAIAARSWAPGVSASAQSSGDGSSYGVTSTWIAIQSYARASL
jgi:hypothetical protein